MYREKILILILAGFGAGVAIRSFVNLSWPTGILLLVLGLFALVFWHIRAKTWLIGVAIFILALAFGIFRYDIKDQASISDELKPLIESQVMLRGTIMDEPDERENSVRLTIELSEMLNWTSKKWVSVPGDRILVTVGRYPLFLYGDKLEIRGKLQKPKNFEDFDWQAYLAKDDIFLQMFYPTVQKTGEGDGSVIRRALFSLKDKYIESVSRVLPEPHASFLGGLTVGARKSIPQELIDDFRKVGIIHIVVLSGYNVTIIAKAIASFLGLFLPWVAGVFTGIAGIIAFAILTGASATVVRASIMAIFIYLAHATGRVYRVTVALFIAGFFMLLFNPKLLRFDASFQLSFLATLGLIFLAPRLEGYARWIPEKFNLRQVALATASAQIAVTPLILQTMGTFSVVALPANMLILLSVPFAMLFGFLTGIAGFISDVIATPFAWITYIILAYELKIVDIFAGLPLSEITISFFPAITALLAYGVIAWFIFYKRKERPFL